MKRLLGIILTGILLIGVTACGDSGEKKQALIAPTQQAIDLTVKTLKQNELVRGAGVGVHKDKSTIKIAIQTKVPLNEQNAKSLIDSGIRQLSGFNDGDDGQPTKNYYGKLWDAWNAEVVVFVNESELTLRGGKIPGKDAPITYTNKGNPAD